MTLLAMPLKKLKLNKYYFYTLIVLFFVFMFKINNYSQVIFPSNVPYYKRDYKFDYRFIEDKDYKGVLSPSEQTCSPYNSRVDNFKVKIDGEFYPKKTPLYQDKRINFTCLDTAKNKIKTILLWNKFEGEPLHSYGSGTIEPFVTNRCPVSNCRVTSDRSLLKQSDFILFHMRSRIDEFPNLRYSWQRWVYLVYESPQHCPMCHRFNGQFNLSATYKSDSDFTSIYLTDVGVEWKPNPQFNSTKNYLKDKNKFSYILVSSCNAPSKRLDYIEELKSFVQIDIYGKCSKEPTNRCDNKEICNQESLSRKYKFYFAFENSVCNDYVTEKFLNTLYNHDIVPVVLGGVGHEKYAPKSAFINALDYETPEQLAKYLLYLNSNETAYNAFFSWKRWIVPYPNNPFQGYLCEMCIQLNLESYLGIKNTQLDDHQKYMGLESNCRALRVKTVKKFEWIQPKLNDNQTKLEMINFESPYR